MQTLPLVFCITLLIHSDLEKSNLEKKRKEIILLPIIEDGKIRWVNAANIRYN